MKDNEYKVAGYLFMDANDYREAKREEETIEYIKANTDLRDINKAVKLYQKLVERKTLKTVVGFAFLNELRDRILREGILTEDKLPCIQVEKNVKPIRENSGPTNHEAEVKHQKVLEEYRIKLRNTRIVSAFLVVIIIAMFLISIFSNRSIPSDYETKILDKYAAWEEELDARQQELDQREAELSQD